MNVTAITKDILAQHRALIAMHPAEKENSAGEVVARLKEKHVEAALWMEKNTACRCRHITCTT